MRNKKEKSQLNCPEVVKKIHLWIDFNCSMFRVCKHLKETVTSDLLLQAEDH